MSFLDRLKREMGDDLSPLERLVQECGKELSAFALKQGAMFPKLIVKAAKRHKIRAAVPYVFWILTAHRRLWPSMDKRLTIALRHAVDLMEDANASPNYAAGFDVPDEADEYHVEDVLEAAAKWARGPLRGAMLQKHGQIMLAKAGEAAELTKLPPKQAKIRLEAAFLVALKRHPRWFKHVDVLTWGLSTLVG